MFKTAAGWTCLVACLFLLSCAKPTEPDDPAYFVDTPMPNAEAEVMAFKLANTILAPQHLYDRIDFNLTTIRNEYGGEYPVLNRIHYRVAMSEWASRLTCGVDSMTYIAMKDGSYVAWNYLNSHHQLLDIELSESHYPELNRHKYYARLKFAGRRNMNLLAPQYSALPGIRYCEPLGFIGDASTIYPRLSGEELSYLFRLGWGDCPSGCIHSKFWYFTSDDKEVTFAGYWYPDSIPTPPDWWNEACKNWGYCK